MTAQNVLRGMVPFRYPGSVTTGPIAVLTNEYNGSDGEAFLEHFKARKLGTVIGVPSWGGLVGILNGQTTIDNGTVQQSNNAFYNEQGPVAHREPRRRPGHPARERPGVGVGGQGRAARQGHRGPAEADQGEAVHLAAGAEVSDSVEARGQKGPLTTVRSKKQESRSKNGRPVQLDSWLLASGFWLLASCPVRSSICHHSSPHCPSPD